MTAAAIAGTLADFKLVKTRSVCAFIVEVPIEQADEALRILGGVPRPGAEVPVALARLVSPPAKPKVRTPFDQLPRSQQAAMLCNEDKAFWRFLAARDSEDGGYSRVESVDSAADLVRDLCNVVSRKEFDTDPEAGKRWDALHNEFKRWSGREQEVR